MLHPNGSSCLLNIFQFLLSYATTSEKAMATHSSTLAWKIPWMEEPARLQSTGSLGVGLSDFTFTFHFHALEKEMATHSSVLAWSIPGTGSLVGCRLWGRTESDTTEATQQQQQQQQYTKAKIKTFHYLSQSIYRSITQTCPWKMSLLLAKATDDLSLFLDIHLHYYYQNKLFTLPDIGFSLFYIYFLLEFRELKDIEHTVPHSTAE